MEAGAVNESGFTRRAQRKAVGWRAGAKARRPKHARGVCACRNGPPIEGRLSFAAVPDGI